MRFADASIYRALTYARSTVTEIKRVSKLDPEKASGLERELHEDALSVIAEHASACPSVCQTLARIALKPKPLTFPRIG